MKHTILLIIVLSILSPHSYSQSVWGLQTGIGASRYSDNLIPTLEIEGYYLKKISPHAAFGFTLSNQKYSIHKNIEGASSNLDIFSITQKSNYLFFSPKIDFGIGKPQNIHAYCSFGLGRLIAGYQSCDFIYFMSYSHSSYYYQSIGHHQNNENINKIIARLQLGISECIVADNKCYIFLYQEFSCIPSYISQTDEDLYFSNASDLFFKTNYFSLGIGITNKYSNKHTLGEKHKRILNPLNSEE